MRVETVWAVGALVVVGYVLLFVLARRPVSLRLARVGCLLVSLLSLRLVLAVAGMTFQGTREVIGAALLGMAAVALVLAWRVWLVRATEDELRAQIQLTCQGLFLGVQEPQACRLQLAVQGKPTLHLKKLASRVTLLVRCRAEGSGKVALLCRWLAKQYPGPVPRLRISLKGGAS
jgi:hypothetical protein